MFADILEGIDLIWDNKFEEAEKIFDTKRTTHARYALHYAEVAFLRSFITADTQDTAEANKRLKAAKDLAESSIGLFSKGQTPPGFPQMDKKELANAYLDTRVVFGDSLYMLAVLQLTRDDKLKGALNMRKSWKVFEECLKAVKDQKDESFYNEELLRSLHFGAGFFLFAMSIIPAKFLKLVELVGFRADREQGLKYVHDCHASGGIRAPFSTMVLLFNNLLLPRGLANPAKYLKEADALISESLKKYPEGSLFQVMGSHCARKQCNVEAGIKCMQDALNNCKNLNCEPLIYRYELASCHSMAMDFATAASHFEPLVEAEKFQVRALCGLQLAGCYQMMDQRDKAVTILQRMPTFVSKKSSVDPMFVSQSKRHLANGGHFLWFEVTFVRRDLAKMEQYTDRLLEALEKAAANTKDGGALKPYKVSESEKKTMGNSLKAGFMGFGKKIESLGSPSKTRESDVVDTTADDRASYLMLRSAIQKGGGKHDEAIAGFREVIAMQDAVKEKWLLAYSLYELGESLYQKGNSKEAQECMKKCNNISGYDWEDPLKMRLRVTIDQLKKGGALDDMEDLDESTSSSSSSSTSSPAPDHKA